MESGLLGKPQPKHKRAFPTTRDSLETVAQRYEVSGQPFAQKALRFLVNSFSLLFTSLFIVWAKSWARVNFKESSYNDPFGSTVAAGLVISFALTLCHRFLVTTTLYNTIAEAIMVVGSGKNWADNAKSAALACFFYLFAIGGGAYLGGLITWGLQKNNAVTFAGVPSYANFVEGDVTRAFFVEFIGSSILVWTTLHLYHNYGGFHLKRKVIAAVLVSVIHAALFYFGFRLTGGCYSEVEFLALASVSGQWQEGYWVYLVAPLASLIFFAIWWAVYRDSKMDSYKSN